MNKISWDNMKSSNERIKIATIVYNNIKQLCSYDYVHIIYIKKGQCIYIDGINEYDLSTGDLIIFPEDFPFQITQASKGFIRTCITFKNQTIQYSDDSLRYIFKAREPLLIKRSNTVFQYLIEEMYHEYISRQSNSQEILYRELFLLLDKIKRAFTSNQSLTQKEHLSKAMLIETVNKLCDKNNTAYISLNDVAEEFRLTPSYFSILFKKNVGINYRDYIKNLRLEKAAFQLLTTNMNIIDVAQFCGFSNTKRFYQAFYQKYGITPAKFRKSRKLSECNSFKTNLSSWMGIPDTWRMTDNGFETININHHAVALCGMCLDGRKSFSYQIRGEFNGISIGLLFGVKNFIRDQIINKTSALILNKDFKAGFMMINSNVYASRLLDSNMFSSDTIHTLFLEYSADNHILTGLIDGERISRIHISQEDITGNLGIIASLASAVIYSAEFNWI